MTNLFGLIQKMEHIQSSLVVAKNSISIQAGIQSRASSSNQHLQPKFWIQIWNLKVPQKSKIFIWKLCHNALSIKDNLYKKKIALSPSCPICNQAREIAEHTFLLCPWTSLVWFGSQLHCFPSIDNLTWINAWLQQMINQMTGTRDYKEFAMALLANTLWAQFGKLEMNIPLEIKAWSQSWPSTELKWPLENSLRPRDSTGEGLIILRLIISSWSHEDHHH